MMRCNIWGDPLLQAAAAAAYALLMMVRNGFDASFHDVFFVCLSFYECLSNGTFFRATFQEESHLSN